MKTDRELLELAAKAAGITGHFVERTPEDGYPGYSCGITSGRQLILWNSLTDDGDALRLAVKLGLTLGVEYGLSYAHASGLKEKPIDGDLCAAMRRAIVRAAAEIGESMP